MPSKTANQRHGFQDQLSRKLVEENQSIGLEDLNVRGRLVGIREDARDQVRVVWLPGRKDQPLVPVFEDSPGLWCKDGSTAPEGAPVVLSGL